jgi:hypothetical protein
MTEIPLAVVTVSNFVISVKVQGIIVNTSFPRTFCMNFQNEHRVEVKKITHCSVDEIIRVTRTNKNSVVSYLDKNLLLSIILFR